MRVTTMPEDQPSLVSIGVVTRLPRRRDHPLESTPPIGGDVERAKMSRIHGDVAEHGIHGEA
jgi:hypothetical protein